jgi:hypothetical protein
MSAAPEGGRSETAAAREEALGAFSRQLAEALGRPTQPSPRDGRARGGRPALPARADRPAGRTGRGVRADRAVERDGPAEMGAAPHAGAAGQGRPGPGALGGGGFRAGGPGGGGAPAPGMPVLPGIAGARQAPDSSPRRHGRQRPVQLCRRDEGDTPDRELPGPGAGRSGARPLGRAARLTAMGGITPDASLAVRPGPARDGPPRRRARPRAPGHRPPSARRSAGRPASRPPSARRARSRPAGR